MAEELAILRVLVLMEVVGGRGLAWQTDLV